MQCIKSPAGNFHQRVSHQPDAVPEQRPGHQISRVSRKFTALIKHSDDGIAQQDDAYCCRDRQQQRSAQGGCKRGSHFVQFAQRYLRRECRHGRNRQRLGNCSLRHQHQRKCQRHRRNTALWQAQCDDGIDDKIDLYNCYAQNPGSHQPHHFADFLNTAPQRHAVAPPEPDKTRHLDQ